MKLIIEKQFDKQGDNFLDSKEEQADMGIINNKLIIELSDIQLIIPMEVFKGLLR